MKFAKMTGSGMLYYEQPEISQYGNMSFKDPDSRKHIEKMIFLEGFKGLIEPNIEHKGNIEYICDSDIAKVFNPWNQEKFADGIIVLNTLMRELHFGVFARSADSMILTLLSNDFVTVLNICIDSLNNGILEKLKKFLVYEDKSSIIAIAGPCLCPEHLSVYGTKEYVNNKISNYKKLGYSEYIVEKRVARCTHYDALLMKEVNKKNIKLEKRIHINLQGIVQEQLNKMGINNIIFDDRCTYEDESLGSALRSRLNNEEIRQDNVVLISI